MFLRAVDWFIDVVDTFGFYLDEAWYNLTCYVYYRYRTVKPASLPGHGWVDRDELMLHCMFQCLIDCIERENFLPEKEEDKDLVHMEAEYLYNWWKKVYLLEIFPRGTGVHEKRLAETQEHAARLVRIRPHLWT